ncbi:MAG: glycosyltransferase 61 family protein [Methylophilus sp.]
MSEESVKNSKIRQVSKWTLQPIINTFRRKILQLPYVSLESEATKVWEISPSVSRLEPKAYFLSNQCERIESYVFSKDNWRESIQGSLVSQHSATRGILLKDVWLIDGTLYKGNGNLFLDSRTSATPTFVVNEEFDHAAIYCTPGGNQYFGQWLIDDCPSYLLAANYGVPVTSNFVVSEHAKAYEHILEMNPYRSKNAYFKELTIFDDVGQNESKRQRFRLLSKKLLSGVDVKPHPGVFILRGKSGMLRRLQNEMEIAEYLRDKRGFRILDPMKEDLDTIISLCAGAETIIGVEGSHLIHGLMVLPKGGSVLIIQPPDRFCTLIKDLTDRDSQHFGFVIGYKTEQGFTAKIDEIERTLDLMPKLY